MKPAAPVFIYGAKARTPLKELRENRLRFSASSDAGAGKARRTGGENG